MPPPKKQEEVQPGDLVDLIARLRRCASDLDSAAYAVSRSFAPFGAQVEACATEARPAIQTAANQIFALIQTVEKTREYRYQRDNHERSKA